MHIVEGTPMDLRFSDRQTMKDAQAMFLGKFGKLTVVNQLDDVPIRAVNPGGDQFRLVRRIMVVIMIVMSVMMVSRMIVLISMVPVVMIVGMFGFRVNVDRAGVYPEFDSGDPFALLALEM
jgi:hypothetical protein